MLLGPPSSGTMGRMAKQVAVLCIHGLLLWFLVPLALLTWLVAAIPLLIRGTPIGPRRFVRWFDLNLIAFLARSIGLDVPPRYVRLTSRTVASYRVRLS